MSKGKKRPSKVKKQKYPQSTPLLQRSAEGTREYKGKQEGSLYFTFPQDWLVTKYDTWKFVKNDAHGEHNGFNGIKDKGIRSVDFACIDNTKSTLWLIEVKDFRKGDGDGHERLWENICDKLLYSMSGLFAAKYAATESEKDFAVNAAKTDNLRFALHLETPVTTNKLEASCIDPSEIQLRMEQKFSRITPKPIVASLKYPQDLPWTVTDRIA